MSSSLFANVLQQNKPPPKAGRKYEAGAAGVPGATGADPLADMPGDDTVPRVSQEGESKYSSGVRGQVQRGGARGGRSNRQVTPTGSPERFSGVHSTPDRMTGNQPSDLADLQDLGVGGAGGEDLNSLRGRAQASRGDGASAAGAARKSRAAALENGPGGSPEKFRRAPSGSGVPGGMPQTRNGVTDVEGEIEAAREKHAQESALANELLRRQIEFEKNASDKMNGFIDRHGFTWYHVLMILIINNIIVVILGASVSSGIMSASFSPLGVVQADSMHAIQAGEQNVVVESVHGPSAVTVRAAGGGTDEKPMDSRLVLEEGDDGADGLVFSSSGKMVTRRSPLRLEPAPSFNLVLQPSAGGTVISSADMDVIGQMDVAGFFVASQAFAVDPDENVVSVGGFGADAVNATLAVSGGVTATGLVELTNPSAGLQVAGGTELHGGADVEGSVVLAGSMSVVADLGLEGRRQLQEGEELMRIESDGGIFTESNVTVRGYANLQDAEVLGGAVFLSDTVFGDHPTDKVTAYAETTFHGRVSLRSHTEIGNDGADIVDVNGATIFHDTVTVGDAPPPSPGAETCDHDFCVWSETALKNNVDISGDVVMTGSVQIGNPGENLNFFSDINVGRIQPFGPVEGGVFAAGDNQMVNIKSDTGDVSTKGSLDVKAGGKFSCWDDQADPNYPGQVSPLVNDGVCDALEVGGNAVFENKAVFRIGPLSDYAGMVDWTMPGSLVPPAVAVKGPKIASGVYGNALDVLGNARIQGELEAAGAVSISGMVTIDSGALSVNGDINLGTQGILPPDELKVYATTEFQGAVEFASQVEISGPALYIMSDTEVGGSGADAKLTIEHSNGNVHTVGTLTVDGKTTLEETEIAGETSLLGDTVIGDGHTNSLNVQATATFSAPMIMGESVSDTMQVWGAATFEESLTAKRAFWAQDNVVLGDTGMDQLVVNAESQFRTQLTAMGYVTLGDDMQDTIVINGQIAVRRDLENMLTIDPSTGTLATQGQLSVQGQADLNAAVTLGSGSADAITIRGESAFSAPVTLGDDSNDAIHVVGRATFDAPTVLESTAELTVHSDITLGAADASSDLTIRTDITAEQDMEIAGQIKVTGELNGYSRFALKNSNEQPQIAIEPTGTIYASGGIDGDTGIFQTSLTSAGDTTLLGNVAVGDSGAMPSQTGGLSCYGNADFAGNAEIAGRFEVLDGSPAVFGGDVTIAATNSDVNGIGEFSALGTVNLGDTTIQGTATFAGATTYANDVSLGDSNGNDLIAVNGRLDVMHNGNKIFSAYPDEIGGGEEGTNVPASGAAPIPPGVTAHGDFTVAGHAEVQTFRAYDDAVFTGDMVQLGSSSSDVVTHGDLTVTSNVVFGPESGTFATWDKTLTVHGDATFKQQLIVESDVSVTGLTVNGVATLNDGATIDGAVALDGVTTLMGRMEMYDAEPDAGGVMTLRMRSSDGDIFAAGSMEIQGIAKIGDDSSDRLELIGRFTVESGVAGEALTFKADPETGLIDINGVTFDVDAEMLLHNNFYIKNPITANTMFSIRSDTGATTVEGDLTVQGELITGDKPLRISTLYADVILGGGGGCSEVDADGENVATEAACSAIGTCSDPSATTESQCDGLAVPGTWTSANAVWTPSESGVTIEGVQFRDGGFVVAKADVINELTLGHGVVIEGVEMKHGTVVIQGKNAGTNPKGEHALQTIVNNAHSWDMDGTITSIVFQQYFEHTSGDVLDHHAADSGKIKVGTETDWSEDSATRDAYMLFETVYHGANLERFRMASNGDITFTNTAAEGEVPASKFHFEAASGDTAIQGDVSVGAVPGMRKLEVSSTNEDAAASITSGDGKTSRLLITGDYAETQLVTSESGDARITMMDQREKGFQWSRSEAGNVLNLDRIKRGTNDVVNVAAGSTEVVSMTDGDFADINVGDQILMNVDSDCDGGIVKECLFGKLIAREVTQLLPDEGATDKIVVDAPFAAGAIVAQAYYVSRRITSVTDDNTMTFGGATASGHKRYNVQSSDSAAELTVTAANARSMGAVTVKSDSDAELRALAGQNQNARLELEELGSCTDPLDETTCTGGKGYTFWRGSGANNAMQLYRTVVSTNQIELVAGFDTLNAFGADVFDDLTIGDYIICTVNGVEEIRKVENLVGAPNGLPWGPGNYPNVITLDSAFDDETAISGLPYKVARPVMSVNDENDVVYGGTTGSKSFTISSLDDAVESKVEAKGESSEALITISSESNSAMEVQCGRNDDARLKLRDSDKNVGYTIARRDEGNTLTFDNTKEINGGGTVSIERSQTTVISSGALFASIKQGDHLVVAWEGVEYSREITAIDVTATPHELTIDLRISDSFDIVDSAYTIGQRVMEFTTKDDVVIGGNSGAKTLVFQSTDDSANMAITAAGASNEGVLAISGEDAVELSLKGGADKDVRVELTDTDIAGAPSAGYRLTRTGSDNDLFLDRTYAGPGGAITVAANSPTVQAANVGDFTDTVKVGDTIIVYVECDATADCGTEQRRTIASVAVDGGTLTVDSAFSTDTEIDGASFQVGRKIISVNNDDQVKIGGSGGDKTFTVESADSNTFLELISAEGISKVDVNGKVALIDINSGVGQNTKLKMRDHDIGTGYLMSRDSRAYSCGLTTDTCADVTLPTTRQTCVDAGPCVYTAADAGAGIAESCVNDCNAYLLMRTEEGAGTVRHTPGSTIVYAAADGQFADIKAQDRLTIVVDGIETTRTVISVNMAVDPDRLTVDDHYGSDVTLDNMPYVIERPIFSVPDEDTFIMGGSTSSKSLSLQSTDEAAFFDITAECPAGSTCSYEARATVQSTTRSSAVVKSGLDEDAVLHLVSTAPRAHGFAMTRGGGLNNKLYLDRTAQGPGGTITCAAGETRVIGANDGDFDHIRIGDKLTVEINGVEYSSLVFSLETAAEPDELHVNVAFHPTESIEDHPYMRYRTVMTVDDDDSVLFGGNKGDKNLALTSTDATATMTITSAGSQNEAQLSVVSGDDYSNLKIESANDKDSRMYLVDQSNTGFLFRKAQGTENALVGFSFQKSYTATAGGASEVDTDPVVQEGFDLSDSSNSLTLERTISQSNADATVDILANSAKLTASAEGDFANIRAGDFVTLIIDGVEVQRTVRMMTLSADPDILDVDSPYSATENLVGAKYFVTRPLVAFDDYESMMVGGAMSAAKLDIISTHDSATLKVEASNSPIDQPDSTGQYGHADIQVVSDGVSTIGVYTHQSSITRSSGIGGDARLKLKDQEAKAGYMMTRMDDGTQGANKFVNFRTSLGPGLKMYCAATETTVTSSNAVNAFLGTVAPGDYIMAVVDGVEVMRRVVTVDTSTTTNTLTVDRAFSLVTSLQEQWFDLLRPVITLTDDNSYLFGGTSSQKTYTIESTDDGATLALKAKGDGNRADVEITSDDIIDFDMLAGADEDVRLKLRDADKGFVMTRDGANTDLVIDQWEIGHSGGITCASGQTSVSSSVSGGFAGIAIGDRIVVEVGGEEQTRLVTDKAVVVSSAVDTVVIDSSFSDTISISGSQYYVSRRTMTTDDTTYTLFGTNGAKTMNVASLDDGLNLLFSAGADEDSTTKHPAQMTLRSEQMSTLSVHAGEDETAKLKLEDYVSQSGYVFIRGDSGNNKLGLDRMVQGGGLISYSRNSLTVTSDGNTHFGSYNVGDFISVVINGVEEVRTITGITTGGANDQLTMSSMLSGQADLTDSTYQIARRVMTVETDDVITLGGCAGCENYGDKVLELLSSDASAQMNIKGSGDRALLGLEGDDATITVSGGDGTGVGNAGIVLRSLASGSTSHYQGFELMRKTDGGNANVLQLDRVTEGPGNTVTVSGDTNGNAAAGGLYVHASTDGEFASLQVGDFIVIELPSATTAPAVKVAREITEIYDGRIGTDGNPTVNGAPDYLTVGTAFSGSAALDDVKYHVQRKVLAFTDDHTLIYGASPGSKSVSVTSEEGAATLSISAAGSGYDGKLTLLSVKADTGMELTSGVSQEARLSLNSAGAGDDASFGKGRGFTLTRSADVARSDANQNDLSLFYTSPGVGATVTIVAGSTTVTSDAGGTSFNGIVAGESITVECNNQRVTRKITSINTGDQTCVVESAFCAEALNTVAYELGKKAFIVENNGETFHIGGAFTDADASDLRTTDLEVKGDVTMSGMMAMKSQTLSAQATITIDSSHVILLAVTGVQANTVTVVDGDLGPRVAGTMLFLENNDDDDAGGPTVTSCPAQSRCTYVYDGAVYQVYAQVDMY
jgi:hypothetical protein